MSYESISASSGGTIPSGSGSPTYVAYWSSANVLTGSSNFTFNSGNLSVGTSVVSPLVIGSTSASGTLTLRATSSATDGAIIFQSDSTTERARFLSTGEFLVGYSTPILAEKFGVRADQNAQTYASVVNATSDTAAHTSMVVSCSSTYSTYALLRTYSAGYTTSGINIANSAILLANTSAGLNIVTQNVAAAVSIYTNSTKRVEVSSVGNVSIGGTATRATTVGTNALQIFNGTAPVGTLTNGCSFYSTAGEMRVMDAAGNATLLSPHEKETNFWIYDSVDTVKGTRLRIDMERMMKFLNDKFGTDFVHEYKI